MAEPKKPVMDVAKPGETAATANSRPIILNKSPAIQDPMVNKVDEESKAEPAIVAPSASRKVISPLGPEDSPTEVTDHAEQTDKSTEPEPETPESQPKTDAEIEADEVSAKATEKAADTKQLEEDQKRQELVEKLVKSKQYFVPIGAVSKRRNNRILASILILVLLVFIGGVAAIDAELIDTNISLPFDLIK